MTEPGELDIAASLNDLTNTDSSFDAEISAKLLALGYARLRLSVILTVGVSLFFSSLLMPFFRPELGYAWLFVLLLTAASRYLLHWVYARTQPNLADDRRWEILFVVSAFLAGASWAFGPITMMAPDVGHASMLLLVTLLSVSAVAMTALSAHLISMLAFIGAALIPTAAVMYASGDAIERVTALAVSAAAIMLMLVGRGAHDALKSLTRTELRLSRTVDQLKIAHDQAEAASLAKTRFLGNMSHELRTPLNAVIGAAQLLQSARTEDDGQQHLIEAIKQSGSSLLHLIEGILDLSRIEAGALQVSSEDFNLIECVEATVATVAVSARIKGLTMACIIEPDVPIWRHGDPALLRQILLNLFGNAVKFTTEGEVIVKVERGSGPGALRIKVTDTGIGIPESDLHHVFEPFNQVDAGTNRRFGGSGLGLAIVRQLVEAMGGHIGVQSEVGNGSTFEISIVLPPDQDPVVDLPLVDQAIAYFEPHAASAEALEAQLSRLGCAAYRCRTQRDLLDWLEQRGHDPAKPWLLVNCDVPEAQDLLEACVDRFDWDRVIGMTNDEAHGVKSPCRYFQLAHHLIKPVLRSALVSRVAAAPRSVATAALPPQPPAALAAGRPAQQKHVLVVEDDLFNRTIVCGLLKHAGYRSTVALDGSSALAILARERFDVVLMDWHMPDMDGLEVTRRLRGGAAGRFGEEVPIVALTANAFAEDRASCLAAGMNDYLTKPVVAENLIDMIERWTPENTPVEVTESTRTSVPPPAFDPTVLAGLPMVADGSEPHYAEEVLEVFRDATRRALDEIDAAARLGDTKTLLRRVHTLKSSCAAVGAMALAEAAERQEDLLRAGKASAIESPRYLREEYRQFERALQHHLEAVDVVTCEPT